MCVQNEYSYTHISRETKIKWKEKKMKYIKRKETTNKKRTHGIVSHHPPYHDKYIYIYITQCFALWNNNYNNKQQLKLTAK